MRDLIIIGSGPAGLSAAVYAKRAMLDVVVIEKAPFSGGQIVNTEMVDNYLGMYQTSGYQMATAFRAHADALGVEFLTKEVKGIACEGDVRRVILAGDEELTAKAVLIATGATHKKLGIKSEKRYKGTGVSYCATCDGAFFRGRNVAVVGGGDVAFGDVTYLARTCEKVYLIHRRDEYRAAKNIIEAVKALPNVELLPFYEVEEIMGDGVVEQLTLRNNQTNETKTIDVAGVFVAIGMEPTAAFANGVVDVDERGYIIAKENGVTSTPGFFVAGDVRTKDVRQIATAVSDGANAIASIQQYLSEMN